MQYCGGTCSRSATVRVVLRNRYKRFGPLLLRYLGRVDPRLSEAFGGRGSSGERCCRTREVSRRVLERGTLPHGSRSRHIVRVVRRGVGFFGRGDNGVSVRCGTVSKGLILASKRSRGRCRESGLRFSLCETCSVDRRSVRHMGSSLSSMSDGGGRISVGMVLGMENRERVYSLGLRAL